MVQSVAMTQLTPLVQASKRWHATLPADAVPPRRVWRVVPHRAAVPPMAAAQGCREPSTPGAGVSTGDRDASHLQFRQVHVHALHLEGQLVPRRKDRRHLRETQDAHACRITHPLADANDYAAMFHQ